MSSCKMSPRRPILALGFVTTRACSWSNCARNLFGLRHCRGSTLEIRLSLNPIWNVGDSRACSSGLTNQDHCPGHPAHRTFLEHMIIRDAVPRKPQWLQIL